MVAKKVVKIATLRVQPVTVAPAVPRVVKMATLKDTARAVNTSRGASQGCCVGRVKEGNWLHDVGCPHTVILYRRYDHSARWCCPYGCKSTALAEGWTHHYTCAFWSAHGTATPF